MSTGGIVLAAIMLLIIPVLIMFGGAIWSALFGWIVVEDRERQPDLPNATTSE